MIRTVFCFALLGTLGYKPTNSASIKYEAVKMAVNKSSDAHSRFGVRGENIDPKPHINLPPGYIPSYIKALISSIEQKTKECTKETSELVKKEVSEILKPLEEPLQNITKERLPEIDNKEETITEIIKLLENLLSKLLTTQEEKKVLKPAILEKKLELPPPPPPLLRPVKIKDEADLVTPELETIVKPPSSPFEEVISTELLELLKDHSAVIDKLTPPSPPLLAPIIFNNALNPITPEIVTLDASVLPRLSFDIIPPVVKDEKIEESLLLEEPINDALDPVIPKLIVIPEAPLLPPLAFEIHPLMFEDKIIKEPILLQELTKVSPSAITFSTDLSLDSSIELEELPPPPPSLLTSIVTNDAPSPITPEVVFQDAPVLPPLSLDIIPPIVEEEKIEESLLFEEPITDALSPGIPKLVFIPEAPVLPPLSLEIKSRIIEEENIEEPLRLEELIKVSPPAIEFSTDLSFDSSIELEELPSPPPSLPTPIVINDVSNPITPEVVFQDAPVLPPLSLDIIPPIVEEEKIEESLLFEEPITDALGPGIPELVFIPEAPVLPPLSLEIKSRVIEEENIEEPLRLEEIIKLSPPAIEFSTDLSFDSSIELGELPSPPPSLQTPVVINDASNPITPEVVIQDAPVLSPISLDIIPPFVEEEKIEESLLFEEPITDALGPGIPELVVILEAPVLPPLSLEIKSRVIEEENFEEPLRLEELIKVSPPAIEFSTDLSFDSSIELEELPSPPPSLPTPIVINDAPSPITPEVVIQDAPVLPPISLDIIPPIVEEEKIEESLLFEEPITDALGPGIPELVVIPEAPVLPPLSLEIKSRVIEEENIEEPLRLEKLIKVSSPAIEFSTDLSFDSSIELEELPSPPPSLPTPIVINDAPSPITPEVLIQDAPVLPPLSLDIIPPIVEEEKIEESLLFEEPITDALSPGIPELVFIPEAPVLPPLSLEIKSRIIEEENIEEPLRLEELIKVSPPAIEFSTDLSFDSSIELEELPSPPPSLPTPIVINDVSNPITSEVVFQDAPVLPPLSLDIIPPIVEEVKIDESLLFEEPITDALGPGIPELVFIPEAPVLPPLSLEIKSRVIEEENIEEPLRLEEIIKLSPPAIEFSTDLSFDSSIELEELPSPPPSLQTPIVINDASNPITPEVVIQDAPVLPPISLDIIPPFVEEEKIEESLLFEEPITDALGPGIPELVVIPEAPVLPPLSLEIKSRVIEEENFEEPLRLEELIKVSPPAIEFSTDLSFDSSIELEELPSPPPSLPTPIVINDAPSPITPEVVIQDAPVLPPISLDIIPPIVEEEKIEESLLFEEPITDALGPGIPELVVIPEAPVLPPLSLEIKSRVIEEENIEEPRRLEELIKVSPPAIEFSTDLSFDSSIELEELPSPPPSLPTPIVINDAPSPITPEVLIQDALVLPPLSLDIIPPIVEEEKINESLLFEEPITDALGPGIPELVVIPEAPVLPPLSLEIKSRVVEEENIEEPLRLEELIKVSPPAIEFSTDLSFDSSIELEELPSPPPSLPTPIVINDAPIPITPEVVIQDAPVLPPISLDIIPPIVEEEKIEESLLFEEPITDALGPGIPELVVIPEAPVLPPLSLEVNTRVIEEEKLLDSHNGMEAPVLPPLSREVNRRLVEKEKNEGQISLHELIKVSPPAITISKDLMIGSSIVSEEQPPPSQSLPTPMVINDVSNTIASKIVVIPGAQVIPAQSMDVFTPVAEKVQYKKPKLTKHPEDASSHIHKMYVLRKPFKDPFGLDIIPPAIVNDKKIKEPTLLPDSIDLKNIPTVGISKPVNQKLKTISLAKITNSKVLKDEMSQLKPCTKCLSSVKKRLPPTTFRRPTKRVKVLTKKPSFSHRSTHTSKSKTNRYITPKLTSFEPYSLQKNNKNQRFRFPQAQHKIRNLKRQKNQFQYYTFCAHQIIKNRIAPNFGLTNELLITQ